MQTKHQIERLLATAGVQPNKRLGQNFLIDLNIMRFIIASAEIQPTDLVLEVGCGTGSLTEGLAETSATVISVEYDKTLGPIAARRVADKSNVTIINTDILKTKNHIADVVVEKIRAVRGENSRLMLVANLPYNVASSVMANLIIGPVIADRMTVTVQKEVAERMAAHPGDKRYGPLSILMGATGESKIIKILPPSVFWPAPQVESAVVTFTRNPEKAGQIRDMGILHDLIHLFMSHRRKTVKACTKFAPENLKKIDWQTVFTQAEVDPKTRPEQIPPEQYVKIAHLIS